MRKSQLESRVRENRMHGLEGGERTLPDPYLAGYSPQML